MQEEENASQEQTLNDQQEPANQEPNSEEPKREISQDRFNNVYGRAKSAERENSALSEELGSMRQQLEELKAESQKRNEKPLTPEAFDYDDEALQKAILDKEINSRFNELQSNREAESIANREKADLEAKESEAIGGYMSNLNKFGEQNPEFLELFERSIKSGVSFSPEVGEILLSMSGSDGPAIHYELLKNPQLIQEINSMDPKLAAFKLGSIKVQKNTTQAPDPFSPVTGGGGVGADSFRREFPDAKII